MATKAELAALSEELRQTRVQRDNLLTEKLSGRKVYADAWARSRGTEHGEILDSVWFHEASGGLVGVVAVRDIDGGELWAAYIGIAGGWSDDIDGDLIATWGGKLPASFARALFERRPFVGWEYRE